MSTFFSGIKNNIAKTEKDFRRMVAVELIGDFCSRKHTFCNTKQYRGQPRHRFDYVKSTGGAKDALRKSKETGKFL